MEKGELGRERYEHWMNQPITGNVMKSPSVGYLDMEYVDVVLCYGWLLGPSFWVDIMDRLAVILMPV